jgi:hypothetical protein
VGDKEVRPLAEVKDRNLSVFLSVLVAGFFMG